MILIRGLSNFKKVTKKKLTALPKWLSSKNDFNKAIKLIEDIRADTNNVKSSSGNKKVFNDLDELINDTKNKKTTRKSAIKKIRNIVSDLDQQRQRESTVLQYYKRVIPAAHSFKLTVFL